VSDFIPGLRADLVEATAREAARGRLQRSRRTVELRLPRPTAVASALALAAVLLALAVALSTVAPELSAARPRVLATLELGGQPRDAALSDGKLWVTDFAGRLVHADVRRDTPVDGIQLGRYGGSVAAGNGGLWAVGQAPLTGGSLRLTEVDPRTGVRLRELRRPGTGGDIAVGAGGLWVSPDDYPDGRPWLERLDPTTGAVTARVRADAAALAISADTVWVLEYDGTLLAVSGATRQVVARLSRLAPVRDLSRYTPDNTLAAGPGGAWLADPAASTVLHVVGGRVVRRVGLRSAPGPLTLAAGAVWVSTGDVISRRYRLLRLSPATGRITATVDLGHHEPKAVIPTADGVWVVASDGTALRIGPS
jgi:hypothetical protein